MSPTSPFSTNRPLYTLLTLGLVIGYTLFVAMPYLRGPSLTIVTPREGETVTGPLVSIYGKTERVSYLAINDLPVPLLEDGTFAVERAYPPGYTVFTVRIRDRFGREEVRTINFLHTFKYPYEPKEKTTD
jgi:hypothetical protein